MSGENEIKALKELAEQNTNILLLTQSFNTYVEKMDEKAIDHRDRIIEIEKTQREHHDDIATLKFEDKCRQAREDRNSRLLWGTFGGLILMIAKTAWEILSKH